jgi:hypothetical protein
LRRTWFSRQIDLTPHRFDHSKRLDNTIDEKEFVLAASCDTLQEA